MVETKYVVQLQRRRTWQRSARAPTIRANLMNDSLKPGQGEQQNSLPAAESVVAKQAQAVLARAGAGAGAGAGAANANQRQPRNLVTSRQASGRQRR
ncbi:hypothetical protein CEP51_010988 [Fusarium floridanum]|uniref:Uncharacterized protein n=1 Tax=Fusarium floridanum TaxID=1325733 RepID=A0A428RCQ4_9HYPO|nr:hypothetical protein CEP51_010988 [Fusarium floridanum]